MRVQKGCGMPPPGHEGCVRVEHLGGHHGRGRVVQAGSRMLKHCLIHDSSVGRWGEVSRPRCTAAGEGRLWKIKSRKCQHKKVDSNAEMPLSLQHPTSGSVKSVQQFVRVVHFMLIITAWCRLPIFWALPKTNDFDCWINPNKADTDFTYLCPVSNTLHNTKWKATHLIKPWHVISMKNVLLLTH